MAQGRLSASGGSDNRDHLAACDMQVDIVKHFRIVNVGKTHMIDINASTRDHKI